MKRLDPAKAPFLGARAPRWRSLRLRDALVLTLPVLAVAAYLLGDTLLAYRRARLFDDWWSRPASLERLFEARLAAARAWPAAVVARGALDPERPDPARLRLRLDRGLWGAWQREPLALWDTWVDASLLDANDFLPVEIRKRGDTSVHWLTEKKSFTLKTPRRSLYRGRRRLVVTVKTPVQQLLSNGLAGEFGLLAPATHLAPVYVNDRFYGLFRVSENVDESFLRRMRRMPGNLFRADAAERGEVYKGLPRGVFDNPVIWERVATNDRPGAAPASLEPFLRTLAGTTLEDHRALLAWLDRDEWARLLAFLLVAGDPYHMSPIHNHYLYEDPTTGLLHPVPWDIRLLRADAPPPSPLNPLLRALVRDPLVQDGAMRALAERLRDDRLLRAAEALLAPLRERHAEALAYERLREPAIPPVSDPDGSLGLLRHNLEVLRSWLADARTAFHARPGAPAVLDFQARGRVGATLRGLELDGALGADPRLRLVADVDLDGRPDADDATLAARLQPMARGVRLLLEEPLPLLPGSDDEAWELRPAPLHYRLFLTGPDAAAVRAVRPLLLNPFQLAPLEPEPWKAGAPVPPARSWHPWQLAPPGGAPAPPAVRRLAGQVHLRETLVVPRGETLVIAAGATLRLDPDVSILARGRVDARGTAERPVRLVNAVPGRPWGALALQGEGASGSRFEHVHFTGGGGAFLERVEYKGMVSAHGARDLVFHHGVFADNLRSDDMLNVVHGSASIAHSAFLRANADAVDFDYSNGEIVHTRFEAPRNDAVDLMSSSPVLAHLHIRDAGDKGISVGEASAPLVLRCRIEDGDIGIEVKDGSEPAIVESVLTGNRVGLRQYAKNWRYGAGGRAKLVDTALADNAEPVEQLDDSRVARPGAGDPRAWLLAHYGVRPAARDGLERTAPALPLFQQRLGWDFHSLTGGWRRAGGVTRLVARKGRLSATLRRRVGVLHRPVAWALTEPEAEYRLVLELSGRGVAGGAVRVRTGDGSGPGVALALAPLGSADASATRLETLVLPPGRYSELSVEAEPGPGGGRLDLHDVRLYALRAAGPS